ncbi:hypothetical protein CYY_000544 [Polysphondylium violaceum]|uniref:Xrn1 N-terminal domain-containing protein n=1 Tax=Polysphondylium violaceum TaxID=133409 RepID=A0A8J4Q3P0_9MYCE|nr:hypothetical protein CYY_000544 [Polysphondylium violaceum]
MGISDITRFINKTYPQIIKNTVQGGGGGGTKYEHVYFDLNNLLYQFTVGKKKGNAQSVLKGLRFSLRKLILQNPPRKSLFLCLDGPGPRSKMIEQKKRRLAKSENAKVIFLAKKLYLEKLRKESNKEEIEKVEKEIQQDEENQDDNDDEDDEEIDFDFEKILRTEGEGKILNQGYPDIDIPNSILQPEDFSSLNFTPGTHFMVDLKNDLINFLKTSDIRTLSKLNDIYISGADRLGEGEWKIIQHIKKMNHPVDSPIGIISNDSDFILYGLINNFNITFVSPTFTIHIPTLKQSIQDSVPLSKDPEQVIVDFVFLSLLTIGSDYLPGVRDWGFDAIWEQYRKTPLAIFDLQSNTINHKTLLQLIETNSNSSPYSNRYGGGSWNNKNKNNDTESESTFYSNKLSQLITFKNNSYPKVNGGVIKEIAKVVPGPRGGFSLTINDVEIDSHKDKISLYKKFITKQHPYWEQHLPVIQQSPKYVYKVDLIFDEVKYYEKTTTTDRTPLATNANSYVYGLLWQMKYFQGVCTDFNYFYAFNSLKLQEILSCTAIFNDIKPPGPVKSSPLIPLYFSFALLDYSSKYLVPSIYHPIYKLHPYYNLKRNIALKSFTKQDHLDHLVNLLDIHTKKGPLDEKFKSQLTFNPTVLFKVKGDKVEEYKELNCHQAIDTHQYELVNTHKDFSFQTNPNASYRPYNNQHQPKSFHQNNNNYNNNNNNNNQSTRSLRYSLNNLSVGSQKQQQQHQPIVNINQPMNHFKQQQHQPHVNFNHPNHFRPYPQPQQQQPQQQQPQQQQPQQPIQPQAPKRYIRKTKEPKDTTTTTTTTSTAPAAAPLKKEKKTKTKESNIEEKRPSTIQQKSSDKPLKRIKTSNNTTTITTTSQQ